MCEAMKTLLVQVRLLLSKILEFIFSIFWECRKEAIPDLEKKYEFLTESATTLARKIKQKELKSEELIRAIIDRIKQVNPIINAVAEERFVAALDEAREVDKTIAAGLSDEEARKKPLLGVPFTMKEVHAVKGMKQTYGLYSRRRFVASEDSQAYLRLREAGAILMATTNVPELLIWQETRNFVYGQTNNPHHTGRTPGGSSGAEAALTATCATTISLCSDLGGSTRMPAFYCGMFGHHPTVGVISLKGVFARNDDKDETMLGLGFISKRVEDLGPLIRIAAGDKGHLFKLDRNVDVKDLKFYYTESADDCLVCPIRSDLKAAMTRVLPKISKDVTSTGNGPEPYSHAALGYMYEIWLHWVNKEPENYASLFHNGAGEACWWKEMAKKFLCMSKHCFFTIMRLTEKSIMPHIAPETAEKLTRELKEDLFNKLGDNAVLLFPSSPNPAPYHYCSVVQPYNFAYWAILNVLKCPVTQVPLGVNSQGLPLGIQVVAAPYNDALCLSVAKYLEKEFGGAVLACKVK